MEFFSSSVDRTSEYGFGTLNCSWNHSREFGWFSGRQGADTLRRRGTLAVVLIFFFNGDIVGLGVGVIDLHVFRELRRSIAAGAVVSTARGNATGFVPYIR